MALPIETATPLQQSAKPGRQGRIALWASAVGFGVEGFDLLILVFLLAPISVAFGLSTTRAA